MRTNMTQWDYNAYEVIKVYDSYVDWEERFYECPCCGESIYECDWTEKELENYLCPICEDADLKEE